MEVIPARIIPNGRPAVNRFLVWAHDSRCGGPVRQMNA